VKKLFYIAGLLLAALLAGCASSYNPADYAEDNPDVEMVVVGKFIKQEVEKDLKNQVTAVGGAADTTALNTKGGSALNMLSFGASIADYYTNQKYGLFKAMYLQVDGQDDPVVIRTRGDNIHKHYRPGDTIKIVKRKDDRYLFINITQTEEMEAAKKKK